MNHTSLKQLMKIKQRRSGKKIKKSNLTIICLSNKLRLGKHNSIILISFNILTFS